MISRRTLLCGAGALATGSTAGLAGCTSLVPCGPGEDEIGDVDADTGAASVEGVVLDSAQEYDAFGGSYASLLLTDGSGTIEVVTMGPTHASSGDCVSAAGVVVPIDGDVYIETVGVDVN